MKIQNVFLTVLLFGGISSVVQAESRLLARWSFDSVLTDDKGKPFIEDVSGNGNVLQFSVKENEDVLGQTAGGRSLEIARKEFAVPFSAPLPYADLSKSWRIEMKVRCDLPGTEQVFLCKEGARGALWGDLSIGYDNSLFQYFLEVTDAGGNPVRVLAGERMEPGKWYMLEAEGRYDAAGDKSVITFSAESLSNGSKGKAASAEFMGALLPKRAGRWIIGRGYPGGFPNSLAVLQGAVADIAVFGEGNDRRPGENPLFGDKFTADPAVTIIDGTAYAYVGEDKAAPGGWFTMPHWLCYSSKDMKHWTAHGPVLAAADFPEANPDGAWAAQVVEHGGKFYFYVTLDDRRTGRHMIDVAVGDSPLGPFRPARPAGSPLITDEMTTDSHRWNADIDPTVMIDDDGTPWMAWGNGDCYMVKLSKNMIDLDGPIIKVPLRNYSEGPWLFKRNGIYYNIYAADAPGVQPEQICYSTATSIHGPWHYRGFITGSARHGFTIHPSVVELGGQWYFFYHDGAYELQGQPGGDCRRQVCVERLYFNSDGTIRPITLTAEGISRD